MANQSDNPRKVVSLPNREDVPSFGDLEREIEAEQAADDARAIRDVDLDAVEGRAHAVNGAISTLDLVDITGAEFRAAFEKNPALPTYMDFARSAHSKLAEIIESAEPRSAEEWPMRLPFDAKQAPVERIVVRERHRKEFGDIQALADSIMEQGLLQPIGLTRDYELVFGERRLRAHRLLGLAHIDIRIVEVTSILEGEFTENEMRQDFTPSERVAIGEALKRELGDKFGARLGRRKKGGDGPTFSEDGKVAELPPPQGRVRDLAAERAGFESGKQFDRASNVVKFGTSVLVEAMDKGTVSISAAAEIAKAAPAEQAKIVALPEPERIDELRRRKADAARLRAAADEQEKTTGPTAYTGFLKKNGRLPDKAEAKALADLDCRATPDASGKRHKPGTKETKEDRAERKRIENIQNAAWQLRQALQYLDMIEFEPSDLIAHASGVDRELISDLLTKGRTFINRFAKEWNANER